MAERHLQDEFLAANNENTNPTNLILNNTHNLLKSESSASKTTSNVTNTPSNVSTANLQLQQQLHLQQQQLQQQQVQLHNFWQSQTHHIRQINPDTTDFKTHQLPLARIKKIMKTDEDVRMISAEAPVLFAKACELFILELSLRSWIHTEENKRRTLQRNDIATAITKTDMFDFLIDIVPREDMKATQNAMTAAMSFNTAVNTTIPTEKEKGGETSNDATTNEMNAMYQQLQQQQQNAVLQHMLQQQQAQQAQQQQTPNGSTDQQQQQQQQQQNWQGHFAAGYQTQLQQMMDVQQQQAQAQQQQRTNEHIKSESGNAGDQPTIEV